MDQIEMLKIVPFVSGRLFEEVNMAYEVIKYNAWPCICGCGKYWARFQIYN